MGQNKIGIIEKISGLDWKARAILAFMIGSMSLLAMPPFFYWTILFVTMPVLVLLLDGCAMQTSHRLKSAAFVGWSFGFGYFLAGFYWVYHAFLVEQEKFGWLIPVVVPLLPALLALFYALACVLAVRFWAAGAARLVALALSFAVVEWVRGHIFTGLPWHIFGYSLTSSDSLMQAAALFGVYGLTFLAIVLFTSPLLLWHDKLAFHQVFNAQVSEKNAKRRSLSWGQSMWALRQGRFFLAVMGVFIALLLWGSLRQWFDPGANPSVTIKIVQPNILQKDKWNRQKRQEIMQRFLKLTQQAVSDIAQKDASLNQSTGLKTAADKTLVIWPESAMPFLMLRDKAFIQKVSAILPKNSYWLTGNVRLEERDGKRYFYNSLLLLDDSGQWLEGFDKKHLIPFGEYMPLKSVFSLIGLGQMANAHGAFTVGQKPRYIKRNGVPAFAPLLCYEVIFPGEIIEKGTRPEWLLNLTNDAWYGLSDGPYQHMHYARVRAVEQGVPMVRAANTGISAIINVYGKVVAFLHLGQSGVVTEKLPRKISSTLYARYGGWMFVFILALGVLLYKNANN